MELRPGSTVAQDVPRVLTVSAHVPAGTPSRFGLDELQPKTLKRAPMGRCGLLHSFGGRTLLDAVLGEAPVPLRGALYSGAQHSRHR